LRLGERRGPPGKFGGDRDAGRLNDYKTDLGRAAARAWSALLFIVSSSSQTLGPGDCR
jgi:hypothetical protein